MAINIGINSIGFWSGITAFAANALFVVVQILQLFRVITYPFDEILIYGFSLCIVVPFIVEILALHYATVVRKKFWSHAALLFTLIYAVFVSANYVVQLTTVIPMTLKGEADKVALLVQYPHSLLWDFDAIGYISMGLASVFVIPIFKKQGFDKWVRRAFMANALVTPLIAFVYFYPDFSERLLLLALPWAITAPMMMLFLAIWFKKRQTNKANNETSIRS